MVVFVLLCCFLVVAVLAPLSRLSTAFFEAFSLPQGSDLLFVGLTLVSPSLLSRVEVLSGLLGPASLLEHAASALELVGFSLVLPSFAFWLIARNELKETYSLSFPCAESTIISIFLALLHGSADSESFGSWGSCRATDP